jgi:malate dehydrogenase (oxaloacetate-decarboxylating)
MLDFTEKYDRQNAQRIIETSLVGKPLMTTPQLNKSTAFTYQERLDFGLLGKLPARIETLKEQVKRAYHQYLCYETKLKRNIYLNNLHDTNQVLFYKLVSEYLEEMLPTIYTPIVGTAVKEFSTQFRQPRGLYLAYPDQDHIADILANRSNPEIDIIVVTDGEGVLGIGDQGIGGMDIPIAKLMVYTLCAGINPLRTLPIQLDMGTNNQTLLSDPLYLGWRNERVTGEDYDVFIERFIQAVTEKLPHVFLHWEDFGRHNARRILDKYRDRLCTFNDDIQGTGAVAVAALLAAIKANQANLAEQRIIVFGAGTAGTGIIDQICSVMQAHGLSEEEARQRFWLIDRPGLLLANMLDLTPAQIPYARDVSEWQESAGTRIELLDVIKEVKPTILIGSSAVPGAFNQEVIETMASFIARPIIFPLSNPTEIAEATPADLLQWTAGRALIATGSPFDPVEFNGRKVSIAQCNNALIFPGIGLGILAAKAKRLTDSMIWAASHALSEFAPINQDPLAPLLPPIATAKHIAKQIALAVAAQAQQDKVAQLEQGQTIEQRVDELIWEPAYSRLIHKPKS